jgi:hypothetical protein
MRVKAFPITGYVPYLIRWREMPSFMYEVNPRFGMDERHFTAVYDAEESGRQDE